MNGNPAGPITRNRPQTSLTWLKLSRLNRSAEGLKQEFAVCLSPEELYLEGISFEEQLHSANRFLLRVEALYLVVSHSHLQDIWSMWTNKADDRLPTVCCHHDRAKRSQARHTIVAIPNSWIASNL